MKKKIEAELVAIAETIIKERGNLNTTELKEKARHLYEKLSILAFTERHLEETPETVTPEPVKPAPVQEKRPEPKPKKTTKKDHDEFAPDGTEYNDSEAITEPNTEKIKDIVAQMPPESERVDDLFSEITSSKPEPKAPETKTAEKNNNGSASQKDFRHIGVDYDNLPDFEPLNNKQKDNRPKSLNDRLKKGINIGLNERLTYIKHLFNGDTADYNRVLSQLNTFSTYEEAHKFIEKVVKPDYNHWEGKEDYEQQFMERVESKFHQ
ncbi:hypothetical protein [Salegentibacter chungangensis]|uniref:DUF4476 domain-containing protein n=1 Tax=Salegentibacter chungangensis TaxID=1335724 RepID=A0ABW3NQK5_9FLAO